MSLEKIIVITGPTATGKSALAVEIAKVFNGEIISADSRQVYIGLDVGSAKITGNDMQGVPHHMINVANLDRVFNVHDFQNMAREKMLRIFSRGKLPIIAGGTGMYISSLIDDKKFPQVPPDFSLREHLEKDSTEGLFKRLELLDPARAKTIDKNNRLRIIRAIEIATKLGNVPRVALHDSKFDVLIIGLEIPKQQLRERISMRIDDRIPGLFDEIKNLIAQGISPERLRGFGLEYRYGTDYVLGEIALEDFKKTLVTKTWQYVRRQMTWWKKDSRVLWMNPILEKQKILERIQYFLSN